MEVFFNRAPVAFFVSIVDRVGVDPRFELTVGEAQGFRVGGARGQASAFGYRRGSALSFAFVLRGKRNACRYQRKQDNGNYPDKPDPLH